MLFNFGKIAAKGVFKAGKFLIKNPKAALLTGAAVGIGTLAYNMFKGKGDEEGEPTVENDEEGMDDYGGNLFDTDEVLSTLDLDPKELASLQEKALADKLMYSADEIKAKAEEDSAASAAEVKGAKGPIGSALSL